METEFGILFIFFLGVFAQFYLLSKFWRLPPEISRKLTSCFLVSLVVFLPWKNEPEYYFPTHLMYAIIVFSGISTWRFRKEILPKIDEQSLLQITIAVWYLFFISSNASYYFYLNPYNPSLLLSLAVLIGATAATLFIAFTKYRLKPIHKVLFHVYFLSALIYLSVPNLKFIGDIMKSLDALQLEEISRFDTFLSGAFFFYLVANVIYIAMLIPFKQSTDEVKEYAKLLESKYDDNQLNVRNALLIIFIQSGLLYFNHRYKVINELMMIYVSISALQLFASPYSRKAGVAPQVCK